MKSCKENVPDNNRNGILRTAQIWPILISQSQMEFASNHQKASTWPEIIQSQECLDAINRSCVKFTIALVNYSPYEIYKVTRMIRLVLITGASTGQSQQRLASPTNGSASLSPSQIHLACLPCQTGDRN